MKKVLILAHTDLRNDPRPLKQIKLLRDTFEVHAVGIHASGLEHAFCEFRKPSIPALAVRSMLLIPGRFEAFYWDAGRRDLLKDLSRYNYELIIAHNEDNLPLAIRIGGGAKVLLDAHEYLPDEDNGLLWRLFRKRYVHFLCSKYLSRADGMLTVAEGISDLYLRNYGVRSVVVMNVPEFVKMSPKSPNGGMTRLIHHGMAAPMRRLESMIEMMDYLGGTYSLDLMLVASRFNLPYLRKLRRLALRRKNVRIIDPVPYDRIIPTLNGYDIGICLLYPRNANQRLALPNKLFEYVQARLAIAAVPSEEVARVVREYNLGVVAGDFTPAALAEAVKSITRENLWQHKLEADKYAERLSYFHEGAKVKAVVSNLIGPF